MPPEPDKSRLGPNLIEGGDWTVAPFFQDGEMLDDSLVDARYDPDGLNGYVPTEADDLGEHRGPMSAYGMDGLQ